MVDLEVVVVVVLWSSEIGDFVYAPVDLIFLSRARNSKSHCQSVDPLVGLSVRPSVPLVRKRAESAQKDCFSAGGSNVTAPAQKHATDDAVYTALFMIILKIIVL